jgi:hypothetical protein
MEIFCRNKIILAILTIPLTEIKIIFTHLTNHLLSYEYQNNKSGNAVATKCRTDTDRKKVAAVASLNQLVQQEKKKS